MLGLCPQPAFHPPAGSALFFSPHFLRLNSTSSPLLSTYSQAIKPQGEDLSRNDSHSFSDPTEPVTSLKKKINCIKILPSPQRVWDMCCNKVGGFSCCVKDPSMCPFKFHENSSKLKNLFLWLKKQRCGPSSWLLRL